MIILSKTDISFPHPELANPQGAIAIGGDLEVDRLLLAYQYGFFPWFNPGEPIIWWHPDPRFVIFTDEIRILLKACVLISIKKNILFLLTSVSPK